MSLPIQGWDYTPVGCGSDFAACFYFVPDYDWVSYLDQNGHRNVPVLLTGTGLYDGTFWIRIDKQPETLWHIGFLPTKFIGHPDTMGHVSLSVPNDVIYPPVLRCALSGCC